MAKQQQHMVFHIIALICFDPNHLPSYEMAGHCPSAETAIKGENCEGSFYHSHISPPEVPMTTQFFHIGTDGSSMYQLPKLDLNHKTGNKRGSHMLRVQSVIFLHADNIFKVKK